MRIAVCMKSVVDSQARIELDADGRLRSEHLRYEVNEYDLYAVEEAIRLAEAADGDVTVITVGVEAAVQGLRKGLAMGAAAAIQVDHDVERLDAHGTATLLAAALAPGGFDLVLAGVESDDLGVSQVGVLVAENLGFAATTLVVGTSAGASGKMTVTRELEGGDHAQVEIDLPAVLTIQTGINAPRYPSLKGIMAAKRKELRTVTADDLGITAEALAPRVETLSMSPPPAREHARVIEGAAAEAATELVRILRVEEKVL